jgi:hypothetical protein
MPEPMPGLIRVFDVNSAAPIRSMMFFGAVNQLRGHDNIVQCSHSCRKVHGSRGTGLRFYGSLQMPKS